MLMLMYGLIMGLVMGIFIGAAIHREGCEHYAQIEGQRDRIRRREMKHEEYVQQWERRRQEAGRVEASII